MDEWDKKGCQACRRKWLSGEGLPKIAVSDARHASLHHCEHCGALWEQYERYVDTIAKSEARKVYGVNVLENRDAIKTAFYPVNPLEELLVRTQKGEVAFTAFLAKMLNSDVYVVSNHEMNDRSFDPAQFERNGETYIAIYTSLERAKEISNSHPYCLSIVASSLLRAIPSRLGIVMNPGWTVGFELPALGVEGIRRDFLS